MNKHLQTASRMNWHVQYVLYASLATKLYGVPNGIYFCDDLLCLYTAKESEHCIYMMTKE